MKKSLGNNINSSISKTSKMYKNRKYFKAVLLFGLAGVLLTVSCKDSLEEELFSAQSLNKFYQNREQAQVGLNGVYGTVWRKTYRDGTWLAMNELPTDQLQRYPRTDNFDLFDWQTDDGVLLNFWEGAYRGINRANTLLDGVKGYDFDGKSNITGQAKFLRGLFYFNLVRVFGGVPLYTKGTTDLSELYKATSPADEIYAQIITDLQDAEKEMSPYSESDHSAGKATSAAATALLAEVYIQRREWQKAADKAKEVIDLGVFGLFADYADIFDPDSSNGKEQIFSLQHGQADPGSNLAEHLVYDFGPDNTSLPDGTNVRFTTLPDQGASFQVGQDFFDRTPNTYRKWMSMRQKMPFYYPVDSSEMVRDTVELQVPFVIKYYHPDLATGELRNGVDTPLLRYSDILLMYAEALNEANASPPAQAYNAINQVRQRARGVGTPSEQPESVYPDLSGLNKDQFRDAVLTEEAREFVGEGKRRFQLLRHDRFIKEAQAAGIDAKATDTLYPIPSDEIAKNDNLTQNPGY